jgi:hypothetical protein
MAHGVVHVYGQLVLANSPFGDRIFLGLFWCRHGQEMVLIEFLFTGKSIEDQEFRSSENLVAMALFVATVVFTLGGISMRDFAYQWVDW